MMNVKEIISKKVIPAQLGMCQKNEITSHSLVNGMHLRGTDVTMQSEEERKESTISLLRESADREWKPFARNGCDEAISGDRKVYSISNKKVIPAQAGILGGYKAPDPCLRRDDVSRPHPRPFSLSVRQAGFARRRELVDWGKKFVNNVLPLAKGESEGVGIGIETLLEFTAVSKMLSNLSGFILVQVGKYQKNEITSHSLVNGMHLRGTDVTKQSRGNRKGYLVSNKVGKCYRMSPLEKPVPNLIREGFRGVLVLLLLALSTTSCISEKKEMKTPDMDSIEILPEVVFSVVDDESLNFFIESRGVVEPIQKITITPRISGFVEAHIIEDGKVVHEGDVLVQFNMEEWELAKQEAYNQYLKAKSEYDVEMRLRGEEAVQNGEGSGYRITTGLADAEVAYERAKLNLSYTTVTAPFSGVISTKEVLTRGAYISAGKELGSLIDTRRVRVRFDVLESEIAGLKSGIAIELEDPSGTTHEGSIVAISPEIDQETKTGQVIAEVNNRDGALKPGMTVEGRVFVRSETSKVRMPRESLIQRDGRTLVFRLHGDEVEWIYVTPVAMTTDWVLIDHPDINPGDTLAVDKHFAISHQQRIIPLMARSQ